MRRFSARVEALGAGRFVLLVGLVAGTIQGIPQLLVGGTTSVGVHFIPFLIVGSVSVVWWTAALLLWWIALRRQQTTTWMIAAQITIGLVLGDLVHLALTIVSASLETQGQFTTGLLREPWTFLASNLQLSLVRIPIWFVGGVVAVAMGRHLNGRHDGRVAAPTPTHSDPVA